MFFIKSDELRFKAQESFIYLVTNMDVTLASDNLFDPDPTKNVSILSKSREFLTREECGIIDEMVDQFIFRIGGYWQDENALICLEYLVHRYSIHKYGVNSYVDRCRKKFDICEMFNLIYEALNFLYVFLKTGCLQCQV